MKSIVRLAVVFLLVATIRAETPPELAADLKNFIAAVEQGREKADKKSDRVDPVQSALMELAAERGEMAKDQILPALRPYLDSDDLRKQCDDLIARFRADRETKEKAATARLDDVLRRAAAAVGKARVPEDLDAAVAELTKLKDDLLGERFGYSSAPRQAARVDRAAQFTSDWQSYLSAVEASDGAQQSELLKNLGRQGWPEAMPRSRILGLMWKREPNAAETPASSPSPSPNPAPAAPTLSLSAIIQGIKSPGDLGAALSSIESFTPADRFAQRDADVDAARRALTELDATYRSFNAGLSTEVAIIRSTPNPEHPVLNGLVAVRGQLLMLVLPRYLHLPEGTHANAEEGPTVYLERVVQEARNRGDYLLMSRAQAALGLIRGDGAGTYDGTASPGLFLVGMNQAEGGQYALAVKSLEKALGSSNPLVPPKVIGDQLAAIKAAHPDEFREGLQNYLSPPEDQYGGPFGRRGAPFGPRGPYADRPIPSKAPALSVPAAAASPASPTKP